MITEQIGLITVLDAILTGRQSGPKLQCLYGNPVAKISVTSRALLCNIHGWHKAIKTREMTENSLTSNDFRFTYTLGFHPETKRKVRISG